MKAAYLVAPRTYEVREIPDWDVPPDGLLMKVEACGICGSDLRRWQEGPPAGSGGIVAGHEIGGIVLEVGKHLSRFPGGKVVPGDHLAVAPDIHCGQCYYCQRNQYNLCDQLHFLGITPGYPGGFAEKLALTGEVLELGVVHRMPEGISFQEAALAEPASSVLATHERLGSSLESTVVVMGAGPIGCLHVAVARARGSTVILSEPSAPRREMAKVFSPDLIVDPFQEDLGAVVRKVTGGIGADLVICANPVPATQTQAVQIVRKAGRVVLFGGLPKADPITHLDGNRIHYGEIELMGSFSYHPRYHAVALDVIRRKLIPADRVITHTFPIEEINHAFEIAASGLALKVMMIP